MFDVLDRVAGELQTTGRSKAQVAQTVASGLRDIEPPSATCSGSARWPARALNRIDAVEGRLAETKLAAQTERSPAEDLDMVQALSDFQSQANRLRCGPETYSMVQRMSLFQYLT